MCLSKDVKTEEQLKGFRRRRGYKVFSIRCRGRGLMTYCQGNSNALKVGVWLNEKDYRSDADKEIAGYNYLYPVGFHIFLTKLDALIEARTCGGYRIRKVEFKNVCATGIENKNDRRCKVVVAKEMKILNGIKKESND